MPMTIYRFAIITEWDSRLKSLAAIAEPERWEYRHVPSEFAVPILRNYIEQTFARAHDQQKLVEADKTLCFNTGLLTPGQEEIFGVFTLSEKFDKTKPIGPTNHKWWFKTWARSGERLLVDLMEFPRLVDYWKDPGSLLFDPKLTVQLNLDHIIRENLSRFPEELGGKVDKNGVPTDLSSDAHDDGIDAADDSDIEEPSLATDQVVPLATRNALARIIHEG